MGILSERGVADLAAKPDVEQLFVLITLTLVTGLIGGLIGFLYKLLQSRISEKKHQVTNTRILDAYIELGIINYSRQVDKYSKSGEADLRLKNYPEIVQKVITDDSCNTHSGEESYTPFIPSENRDFTLSEIRDLIGHLKTQDVKKVYKYFELEAYTHALTKDFRSEYVRHVFTRDRKVALFDEFNDATVKSFNAARCAKRSLATLYELPVLPLGPAIRSRFISDLPQMLPQRWLFPQFE